MTFWTICPKICSKGVIEIPDYRKMYLTLFDATEKTVNDLIEAQKKCEELYIADSEEENKEEGE